MKIWPLALIILILCSFQHSIAEELNSYVPPPLFNNSSPKQNLDELIEKPQDISPKRSRPIIKPPVKPKKNFAKKPLIKTTRTEGIVKGPIVMPAVKKQNVEAEVIFEPDNKIPSALLKRTQKKITMEKVSTKKITKKIVKPKKKTLPPKNIDKKDWVFNFSEEKIAITQVHKDILLKDIIPLLNMDTQARLFIEASATSSDTTKLNADRRTALSRAITIRSYLLEQGITPDRIDVRAMGNENPTSQSNQAKIKLIN